MPGSPSTVDAEVDALTALIVDDDEDMRLLLRTFLTRAGMIVVEEAVDGPQALEIFERLHPPPVPTVIVLDSRMPTLSGLEVAAMVLARVPAQRIVLFSAYLSDEVRAQAEALGVTACLAKTEIRGLAGLISSIAAGDS